jgi:hypothetical protein
VSAPVADQTTAWLEPSLDCDDPATTPASLIASASEPDPPRPGSTVNTPMLDHSTASFSPPAPGK